MKPLDPIALTRQLVDIESLTYNEAAVGEFLHLLLQERGFTVERTDVPQPPNSRYSGPRFNVYGGDGKRPDVVLSTHMDTVPPFIPSSEDDEFLYGRGSCDAKGILAAQLAAGSSCVRLALPWGCCLWWARNATPRARGWPIFTPKAAAS